MTHDPTVTVTPFIWKCRREANPNRPETIALRDFELVSLDSLLSLEPEPPLTKLGQRLREACPDQPELWEHRISRAKNAKPKPVDAWLFIVGDSEFQTIPQPPQLPSGRLAEEHELGELSPEEAENGRFFFEVRRQCQRLGRGRIPLSYQIRLRQPSEATPDPFVRVYSHPEVDQLFPGLKPSIPYPKQCFVSDYLSELWGRPIRFVEVEQRSAVYKQALASRRLTLQLNAFFTLADYADLLPYEKVTAFLEKCVLNGDLEMGRRMKVNRTIPVKAGKGSTGKETAKPPQLEILDLPLLAVIGDRTFAVRLHILDSSAMLGQSGSSLKKLTACSGRVMKSKDLFSSSDKGSMLYQWARAACDAKVRAGAFGRMVTVDSHRYLSADSIYREDPEAFVKYAAGDVQDLDKVVVGVEELFRRDLYGALGWGDYYKRLKLTAGASILDFVKAGFLKSMEAPMQQMADNYGFLEMIGCSTDRAMELGDEWLRSGIIPEPAIRWLLKNCFERASSAEISKENNLMAANAKVLGGRCINLAPNIPSVSGALVDMDLASAYTKSLTVQDLPFGRPSFIGKGFDRDDESKNDYRTLREVLDRYGDDLVPGLYQFWISCSDLPTPQDFFPSWDKPKAFNEYDNEEVAIWLERTDLVKHFLDEFTDSPLTHDTLQWLLHIASPELREYILDNARVTAAAFYQKQFRCSSPAHFIEEAIRWQVNEDQKHKSDVVGAKEIDEKNYCPYWFAVNLGELAINKFNDERQIYKKITKAYKVIRDRKVENAADLEKLNEKDRDLIVKVLNGVEGKAGYKGGFDQLLEDSASFDKYPLDELFKLAANTTYGVMVSRFFILSNPIVGNNITARVRTMIWLFEKACASMMSITDGGVFDLNRVVYPRKKDRKLTEKALTLLHQKTREELKNLHLTRKPIGGFESIQWTEDGGLTFKHKNPELTRHFGPDQITGPDSASSFVDQLTMDHTRMVFAHAADKMDVLKPIGEKNGKEIFAFEFEAKGIVRNFVLQGQSNYYLEGGSHGAYPKEGARETVAMRGIKKSLHTTYVAPFLRQLLTNPNEVVRGDHSRVYLQGMILKTGEFRERYESFYKETFLKPGDSYYKAGLIRECSVSGFRYRTMRQMKAWERRHSSMREYKVRPSLDGKTMNIVGGQSFESFYLNEDGSLRYREMVESLSKTILSGSHPTSRLEVSHPSIENLAITKFRLKELIAAHPTPRYIEVDEMKKKYESIISELKAEEEYVYEPFDENEWMFNPENLYC